MPRGEHIAHMARLMKGKLFGIPTALQQENFNALREILDLLEAEDTWRPVRKIDTGQAYGGVRTPGVPEHPSANEANSDGAHGIEGRLGNMSAYIAQDWETVIDSYFTGFNYCIRSFSSVVEPTVASSLQQLRLLQRKLDKAQLYATGRLHDLKDTHLTRVQQNEMLRILNKVEELSQVIPKLDELLHQQAYSKLVKKLNWALTVVMGDDIARIGALVEIRSQLLARKNEIYQYLLKRVQNIIFLRRLESGKVYPAVQWMTGTKTVLQQSHCVEHKLTALNSYGQPFMATIWQAHKDSAVLQELADALNASLIAPVDMSFERVVKSAKNEAINMVHKIASAVECGAHTSSVGQRCTVMPGKHSDESFGGLHRPSSDGLVAALHAIGNALILVFSHLVRFSDCCGRTDGRVSFKHNRNFALAEVWREMQNTVELFVLSYLQGPRALHEATHASEELLHGHFQNRLNFRCGVERLCADSFSPSTLPENQSHAGCGLVSSPYHIINIYNPLLCFAEIGFQLLVTAGTDTRLAHGSYMLPVFVDDFVKNTFANTIVQDTNRLCLIALQSADAFSLPPAPSRMWQPDRRPFKSCSTVVQLIETLAECAKVMPVYSDVYIEQISELMRRCTQECDRHIDNGCKGNISYHAVNPFHGAHPANSGFQASASAFEIILQGQSSPVWRHLRQVRIPAPPRQFASKSGPSNAVKAPMRSVFTNSESVAMFRSEFAALAALTDQHDHSEQAAISMSEQQYEMLANAVDTLAYLIEHVQLHAYTPAYAAGYTSCRTCRWGRTSPMASCHDRDDPVASNLLPTGTSNLGSQFLSSSSHTGSWDAPSLGPFSDCEPVQKRYLKALRWSPLISSISQCWTMHDKYLIMLRLEMRCQCLLRLRRTRQILHSVDSAPVNPEDFVVSWNRVLQRLHAILTRCAPREKVYFVLCGLCMTMTDVLEHHSGPIAATAGTVMQMQHNVFAMQKVIRRMYTTNVSLRLEVVHLDQLMRRLFWSTAI